MRGKRNISGRKSKILGKALGLQGGRLFYFMALVRFNQCGTAQEKEQLFAQLVSARPRGLPPNFNIEHYLILESWHCLAILELTKHSRFSETPAEISRLLKGRLRPGEAKAALALLLRMGMLVRGAKGKLQTAQRILKTSDEVNAVAVRKYHKSCLRLGLAVLESDQTAVREFSSLNVALTEEQFAEVKLKMKKFREEIAAMQPELSAKSKICQLNVQLLSLSEPG